MSKDKLFIPIENIDYDCFISTGKQITRKSDKNTELSLLHEDRTKTSPEQSFQSTMMIQAQLAQMQRNASNSISNIGNITNDEDNDGSDREDLPFIHNIHHLYGQGHDSDISNISSHVSTGQGTSPAIMRHSSHSGLHAIQHSNMPVST